MVYRHFYFAPDHLQRWTANPAKRFLCLGQGQILTNR